MEVLRHSLQQFGQPCAVAFAGVSDGALHKRCDAALFVATKGADHAVFKAFLFGCHLMRQTDLVTDDCTTEALSVGKLVCLDCLFKYFQAPLVVAHEWTVAHANSALEVSLDAL